MTVLCVLMFDHYYEPIYSITWRAATAGGSLSIIINSFSPRCLRNGGILPFLVTVTSYIVALLVNKHTPLSLNVDALVWHRR
jgi:hypothetical protein